MCDQIQNGKHVDKSKLKNMARKGIPDSVRSVAWPILSKSDKVKPRETYEGRRQKWMSSLLANKLHRDDLKQILKDIPRTLASSASASE